MNFQGTIVPIAAGVMRNIWYPRKMAGYMTMARLTEIAQTDLQVERDSTFGSRAERKRAKLQLKKLKAAESIVEIPLERVQAATKEPPSLKQPLSTLDGLDAPRKNILSSAKQLDSIQAETPVAYSGMEEGSSVHSEIFAVPTTTGVQETLVRSSNPRSRSLSFYV
jgi:hypothetical protein